MAVGCPFCMRMMEDALKSRSLEDQMRVRDLSELIAESTQHLNEVAISPK
jgi:Fe-S oxidoreductase